MYTDNLDKFLIDLRTKFHQAKQEVLHISEMLDEAKEAALSLELTIDVLEKIADGGHYQDPGKYGPAFYIFDSTGRQVLPEECVGENHPFLNRKDSLIKLADARTVACPHCGRLQIEIVKYHQTFDSPEGDEWAKEYFAVCEECQKTWTTRPREVRETRF